MKKTFSVDIWDCKVNLCTTSESYVKLTKEDPSCDCLCAFDGRDVVIFINLSVFTELKPSSLWRSVSHESNHAAMTILDNVGVTMDGDNQEALCYTQDMIFANCYEIISRELSKVE